MKNSFNPINRSQSLNALKHVRHKQIQTLAQKNLVSLKQPQQKYFINRPLRILLPDFFNIPKFIDRQIDFLGLLSHQNDKHKAIETFRQQKGIKRKLKDLSLLAEGMKRAKNIRQQSRYYFIQGIILHNSGLYDKSIQMLQKFLKIVLFIKDQKSVQLALNSIGIAYMYLNRPQQALLYHQKQIQLNQNSQQFIGRINIGLCFQMLGRKDDANIIYGNYLEDEHNSHKKAEYVERLFQRTKEADMQQYYLTEGIQNKTGKKTDTHFNNQNQPNKYDDDKQKQNMLNSGKFKSLHNNSLFLNSINKSSPSNNTQLLKLKKSTKNSPYKYTQINTSFENKRYENAKVNFAIFHAEQGISNHLKNMKHSFSIDN